MELIKHKYITKEIRLIYVTNRHKYVVYYTHLPLKAVSADKRKIQISWIGNGCHNLSMLTPTK